MTADLRTTFESLHTQYHAMVSQMCMGFVKGDREQAHDLAQEIFINAWNALPGFRGDSTHKTWIYRITVNTCLMHLRKVKQHQHVALEQAGESLAETNPVDIDASARLYAAIGQLESMDRLIIMMVLDELAYEEIARIVGITENNLRVRIHRIRQRLKAIIEHGKG